MNGAIALDLADCTEFRQTIERRPPAVVHGTSMLLASLLAAAVAWAAFAEADLVVRAAGRVRPVDQPARAFSPVGSYLDGRVVEVFVEEGDAVEAGQVLVRLDTQRLANEMAGLERRIAALDEEVGELARLDALVAAQYESAKAKAQADLSHALAEHQRALDEQRARISQAAAALSSAEDRWARNERLARERAVSQAELVESRNELIRAREEARVAALPVSDGQVEVLRRALDEVDHDFRVRRAEIGSKRMLQQGDADAARRELANLVLEQEQSAIRAPIGGLVTAGDVKVGGLLEPGSPVFEIARQDGFRFEVGVASEDVGELAAGMPVKIKFDAYDYQRYGTLDGSVVFISPDSRLDGESTDADAAPNYVVRIHMDRRQVGRGTWQGQIKLGMGGTAEIVTSRESILMILAKRIRRSVSLG